MAPLCTKGQALSETLIYLLLLLTLWLGALGVYEKVEFKQNIKRGFHRENKVRMEAVDR